MTRFWKISNRATKNGAPTGSERGPLRYYISDSAPFAWKEVSASRFDKLLTQAADAFPLVPEADNPDQRHVTLLVHGYNVAADEADALYRGVCDQLYAGPGSLGICVSFDWPSLGSLLGYYPDRAHARECAGDLAAVLDQLYQRLVRKQADAEATGTAVLHGRPPRTEPCKAKISIIAHSMGNYVLQKAFATIWTRINQPLRVSLVNQLVMVAADVDNNLFDIDSADASDGIAIANLTYRVTSLYSGRDNVLGASAGLKHFGTRRLGRSGLANRPPRAKGEQRVDNVWEIDCSSLIDAKYDGPLGVPRMAVHGSYFDDPDTMALIRDLLRGTDRTVLEHTRRTSGNKWP